MPDTTFTLQPIARVRSPFRERFGIPRQAGLAPAATGTLVMLPPYDDPDAFDGLDGFSHIWVTFQFHANDTDGREAGWQPRVRPPRLGGNRSVGVFASRSPFRPNRLGLSALRLLEVRCAAGVELLVGGIDLLDGTPVFDIKPYVPYSDRIDDATGGFAPAAPVPLAVRFAPGVRERIIDHDFEQLIREVLALDPRPAYHGGDGGPARVYGMRLGGMDVRWRVDDAGVEVIEINRES